MINETFFPLEAERIRNNLKKDILEYLPEIVISEKTASTNDDAKLYLPKQSSELSIHLTEQQEAGKGRNGKKWVSPKGKNIYLSLGWKSPLQYSELDGLSLSVGCIVANVLNSPANSANDKPKEPKPIPDQYNDLINIEGLPKYFGNEDEETKKMRGDY